MQILLIRHLEHSFYKYHGNIKVSFLIPPLYSSLSISTSISRFFGYLEIRFRSFEFKITRFDCTYLYITKLLQLCFNWIDVKLQNVYHIEFYIKLKNVYHIEILINFLLLSSHFFRFFLIIFFIYSIILDILFKIPLKHIEVRNNDRKASQQWIPLQICGRNVRRADWSQPF